MSQGWHCTVAAATGRELTASWWTFQRQSDSKGRFWGFEFFFLCLGNFQEKFQGQIIDLHLWFLSRCFMHRPSLLPKGVKMPRELNLTEEMPRDEIQRKDTSTCHQVVLLDLFREKFLLCKSQHTHNTAKIQAWPGKWIGQI